MSPALPRRDGSETSRVRGARFELSGSFGFIYSLLCDRATILMEDPDEIEQRSPMRALRCGLLRNVSGSAFISKLLTRLYQSLGACESPCGLVTSLCTLRQCCSAIRPPFGFRQFVGNAVAPASFNDLANINATLGSYYWLGFITTGLSPDKKRLALLGAQRPKDCHPLQAAPLRSRVKGSGFHSAFDSGAVAGGSGLVSSDLFGSLVRQNGGFW